MADIVTSGEIIAKYVSASINFATAANGTNIYGTTTWDEPRTIIGVQIHCTRTVALANGTNTELMLQVATHPTDGNWTPLLRGINFNADIDAAFNGWTWTNANSALATGLPVQWTITAGSDISPLNVWGMRLVVERDAGDATLAGTITNVWLSTIPWR